MKIWLIQNIISPYRIKLFQAISETKGVDFKLILLAKGIKNMPQWNFSLEEMPFKAERVPGVVFYTGYENQICLNPLMLFKMIRENPGVIICAGFSFATLIALVYKLIFGGRYVIWMEGTHITETKHSRLRIVLRKIMARFASGFVDAGTLSREYLESLLPKQHEKPFFRSYNCVDNKKFMSEAAAIERENLREFNERFPNRNILFVGQLVERKGIILLLEVYKNIVDRYHESVGLVLVGHGPLKEYVEAFKEKHGLNNIFLEGFVKNDELPKYYGLCDLFMLLSIQDPNPLVIFEALSSGIPLLCSNRAGNAVDFVLDGKNGYVVDPFDLEDATSKAIKVLDWQNKNDSAKISREVVKKANYADSAKAFVDACRYSMKKTEAG